MQLEEDIRDKMRNKLGFSSMNAKVEAAMLAGAKAVMDRVLESTRIMEVRGQNSNSRRREHSPACQPHP